MASGVPIPPETLAEAKKLLDEGKSRLAVSRTLDIGRNTLTKYFPTEKKSAHDLEAWDKLLEEGMGYKHVAEVYGVSHCTVRRYFPERGWTREQVCEHAAFMRNHKRKMSKVTYV